VVIERFQTPKKVNVNNKRPIVTKNLRVTAELEGLPMGDSLSGMVYLYKAGAMIDSAPITVVAGDGGDRVTFEYGFSAADAPEVTFRAQVVVGNDGFSVQDEALAIVQVTDRDVPPSSLGSPR